MDAAGGVGAPAVAERDAAVLEVSLHYGWIPAKNLKPGMHLKTPDGQSAVVVGGSVPAAHDGWMWDLTVPGNNDHDFYVLTMVNGTPVLVHNTSGCMDAALDDEGDAYVRSKHMPSGALADETKGLFNPDVDLFDLADKSNDVDPIEQINGNWQRIVTAPDEIGTDVETGLPTNIYTVIQDVWGAVRTMHPGVPR